MICTVCGYPSDDLAARCIWCGSAFRDPMPRDSGYEITKPQIHTDADTGSSEKPDDNIATNRTDDIQKHAQCSDRHDKVDDNARLERSLGEITQVTNENGAVARAEESASIGDKQCKGLRSKRRAKNKNK